MCILYLKMLMLAINQQRAFCSQLSLFMLYFQLRSLCSIGNVNNKRRALCSSFFTAYKLKFEKFVLPPFII